MSKEPTSPDLAELSRRRLAAVNRRDIDAVMSFFAADPVWDMSPINMGIFEGRAAIRGALETWWETFDGFVSELDEVLDLGHGVLFQSVTQRGRLAGSEGEIRQRSARVFVLVDSLIERLTSFNDIDEARSVAERLAEERG
jgi:ketosteroid isomerase-like protein